MKSAFQVADSIAKLPTDASAATRARTRALVLWAILAVPLGVSLILTTQTHNLMSPLAIGVYAGSAGLIGAIFYLRATQRLSAASMIFVVSIMLGLGATAWLVDVPDLLPLIFMAVTPVYYGLMVNWKKCLHYTIVLSVFFFALAIWVSIREGVPEGTTINILGCAFAAIGSGLCTTAYSYTTDLATRKLKRQNTEIVSLAFKDALTSINNRRAFNDRLNDSAPIGAAKFLAAIDLNGFKGVNDQYGHEVGDEVLRELAGRLTRVAPEGAEVYRVGGDEFAVIADAAETTARQFGRDLSSVSKDWYPTQAGELSVKVSIGLSALVPVEGDLRQAYREADIALFEAKRAPEADFRIYSEELGAAKNRAARLSELLKDAITLSKVDVAFQPQFDMTTETVTGFEALARWRTDAYGEISPGEFVPIADQAGLIVRLDRSVFRIAIGLAEAWLEPGLKLALNASGKTLLSRGFVDYVKSVVEESRLSFDQITIEITETEIIESKDDAKIVCDALRALGVSIALDDFGTGYSSLSYLSTLPVNTLKIDRSFVKAAHIESNAKIMKSIIGLARSLGLSLLVEGVERSWQLDVVKDMGCNRVQGFYFSRPLTSEQCAELLKQQALPSAYRSVEALEARA